MPNFFVVFFDPSSGTNGNYKGIRGPNADTTFTADTGLVANGLASIQSGLSGKFVAFNIAPVPQGYATTSFGNPNANLTVTAKAIGTTPVRFRLLVAGNSTSLTVSVSSNDITVNVATDSSGNPTSTASQVIAAFNGNGSASALAVAALAPGSSGAAAVSSLDWVALSNFGSIATTTSLETVADSALTTF